MRATVKNYIEAEKRRREEEGDEGGFSLIELIIVVVILGILVAIAIPIFASIQATAQTNALKAAAANGASAAAAAIAQSPTAIGPVQTAAASAGDPPIVTALTSTSFSDVSTVCVQASAPGYAGSPVSAGPGC